MYRDSCPEFSTHSSRDRQIYSKIARNSLYVSTIRNYTTGGTGSSWRGAFMFAFLITQNAPVIDLVNFKYCHWHGTYWHLNVYIRNIRIPEQYHQLTWIIFVKFVCFSHQIYKENDPEHNTDMWPRQFYIVLKAFPLNPDIPSPSREAAYTPPVTGGSLSTKDKESKARKPTLFSLPPQPLFGKMWSVTMNH